MEVTTIDAAQLLGISRSQLHRYSEEGKITCRLHGPRGRKRYEIEQLRIDAQALRLPFDEELLRQFIEKSR